MLKKTCCVICLAVTLTGCGNLLPGMQNLNTAGMRQQTTQTQINVNPTLIPITPSLIADTHISRYYYYVAPADVLSVSVWNHPEFGIPEFHAPQPGNTPSTQGSAGQSGYLVNPDGYIYFPLIGNVMVAGKTIDQVRQDISLKLKRFIRNPQVNTRIVDFRGEKIYVFGEVNKPGFIPLNDQPLTIVDALTMVGSFDSNAADPSHIYVIRGNFEHPNIYWLNAKTADAMLLAEHFNLQPGDVLYVSSAVTTRWNRIINQLLPTVQTVWYTKATIGN